MSLETSVKPLTAASHSFPPQYQVINDELEFELSELSTAKCAVDVSVETTVKPEVVWNSKLKKLADEIDETKFEIAQTHKECRLMHKSIHLIAFF